MCVDHINDSTSTTETGAKLLEIRPRLRERKLGIGRLQAKEELVCRRAIAEVRRVEERDDRAAADRSAPACRSAAERPANRIVHSYAGIMNAGQENSGRPAMFSG